MPNIFMPIFIVILSTVIGAIGAIALKKASSSLSFNLKSLFNRYFLIGMGFYAISTIIYLNALKLGELSILFPIVSTTYIWVCLLSQKYLGEKMNGFKWFGILVILVGVALLAISGR
ncbi:MAG TPA: EamA family transporter [Nanoarchaeota archaeon]|nr:MAG: undecaprenyl phosphate-alpha-L-ara4N flippase subunit ArnE [archaeon GW2011_AR6]MBS3083134.1 EamA family transporter [Candidatus Pacearchaeota archaeon]HIH17775.1 EamA family transporter [Nanoarchaeota archaeon]HIH34029.1 EamA family transporter [Nanoarchaeota archaeon]HIH51643.1 EamA family transporter [Nanoarchaeota archaeon]